MNSTVTDKPEPQENEVIPAEPKRPRRRINRPVASIQKDNQQKNMLLLILGKILLTEDFVSLIDDKTTLLNFFSIMKKSPICTSQFKRIVRKRYMYLRTFAVAS